MVRSHGFFACDDFRLFEDELSGSGFLVGWVTVLQQKALDGGSKLRSDLLFDGPVGLRVAADDVDEFVRDLLQCVVRSSQTCSPQRSPEPSPQLATPAAAKPHPAADQSSGLLASPHSQI
jgi:hypothetical protein